MSDAMKLTSEEFHKAFQEHDPEAHALFKEFTQLTTSGNLKNIQDFHAQHGQKMLDAIRMLKTKWDSKAQEK